MKINLINAQTPFESISGTYLYVESKLQDLSFCLNRLKNYVLRQKKKAVLLRQPF